MKTEEAPTATSSVDVDECEKTSKLESIFPIGAPVPEGLTSKAKQARRNFERRYNAELKRAMSSALSILVWGPGSHSPSPVARKRICIRYFLKKLGHNAFFSEEYAGQLPIGALKIAEFAQAKQVDLIIALIEESPGAMSEISDFGNHPEIAPNVLVMCPLHLKDGYFSNASLSIIEDGFGGVHWYATDEIESCNVLNRAIRCAEARRYVRAFVKGR